MLSVSASSDGRLRAAPDARVLLAAQNGRYFFSKQPTSHQPSSSDCV
jgi:hypothetical protein